MGSECLQRPDGAALHTAALQLACHFSPSPEEGARHFNVLHRYASQVAALDLGYTPGLEGLRASKPKVAILLGADQGQLSRADLPEDCMVIYIGVLVFEYLWVDTGVGYAVNVCGSRGIFCFSRFWNLNQHNISSIMTFSCM